MKQDEANQLNTDETERLNSEIAPIKILFGATFISVILVCIAAIIKFILGLAA